ncbi:hypothetical protein ST201phi2-1p285 [Pseudomonas phage 201phi2-1]|uniref:Uncharacterized protein n=1 Tax=Pseudomonas phage 201phi2-1 TaxID=198110 RepID=B3FJE6_BP201|nr:hypothetical protein ST201phi2-1p285 [Pseudomonas phage 201phi2-1]ABY63112.1 hypothetical protein 201phi2-1p285 [Pseudomonas phage 201phi2-1]
MGLDTDIYRVNRKKAEAAICKSYDGTKEYIDYWSITDDVESVCYQRKNYFLQGLLEELTWSNQCEYIELTKLHVHHLVYCMQQRYKWQNSFERKRAATIVRDLKQVLHNFDWDRDMLVWNWC